MKKVNFLFFLSLITFVFIFKLTLVSSIKMGNVQMTIKDDFKTIMDLLSEQERKKIEKTPFHPFLEEDSDKNKVISPNFLGEALPKNSELEEEYQSINCDNYNPKIIIDKQLFFKLCIKKNPYNKNTKPEITKIFNFSMNNLIELWSVNDNITRPQRNIECNVETCSNEFGLCNEKNDCLCNEGFVDDPDVSINKFCSYKQKKQFFFFLTEFFAPFGLGHILYGRLFYGILKCSIFVFIILFDFISKCVLLCRKERGPKWPSFTTIFYYSILIFWHAYDITMIGFNKYKEENGVPYIPVQQ